MAIAQNGPGITGFHNGHEDGLLEPHPHVARDAPGGQQDDRPGRLSRKFRADGHVCTTSCVTRRRYATRLANCRGPQSRNSQGVARDQRRRRSTYPEIFGLRSIDIELPQIVRFRATGSAWTAGDSPMRPRFSPTLSFPVILNGAGCDPWLTASPPPRHSPRN